MSDPIRVMIVDDHRLFSQALELLLGGEDGIEVVGTAETGEAGLDLCRRTDPDVALVDIDLPGMDGITTTRLLHETRPETRVVVITAFQQPDTISEAVRAGACGYVMKTDVVDTLVGAIRLARAGKMVLPAGRLSRILPFQPSPGDRDRARQEEGILTYRETQILKAIAEGTPTSEMAHEFAISEGTVRSHVKSILSKLGVHSKAEAVMKAFRLGLISGGSGQT